MAFMHEKMTGESADWDFPSALAEQISRGAEVIRQGGIVAFPTDTVYGLGADIYNDSAVNKVFTAKARPLNMPLPVLIADATEVENLIAGQTTSARLLMDKFWPGGLTIIFKRAESLHSLVLAGSDKIGIRVPGHLLTRRLIKLAGSPIAGTSANLHHRPAVLTSVEVNAQLGSTVDFIIEGGTCPGGTESTIIDVTVEPPVIIRQGIIPLEAINTVIQTGGNK